MLPASMLVKDETDIRAISRGLRSAELFVPPDPRLMTSMPSARTAAHSGKPLEDILTPYQTAQACPLPP
jgi:hypothetical protein